MGTTNVFIQEGESPISRDMSGVPIRFDSGGTIV